MRNNEVEIKQSKYLHISELGSKFNLSFSSCLELGNKVMALDGLKKCLLVYETSLEFKKPFIIDLGKVSAISVKKCYSSLDPAQLKGKRIDELVKSIDLEFKYGRDSTIVISFYDCKTDNISNLPKLERSAISWQMFLSKIIRGKLVT